MFPRLFYRTTKHKKPRNQLYQPGFNANNTCWLEGGWVVATDEQWAERERYHATMSALVHVSQHYQDPPTPISDLTPEQRTAWLHYSGQLRLWCIDAQGGLEGVSVSTQGASISSKDAEWLRKSGWRVLRYIKDSGGIGVIEQLAGLPEDLQVETPEPMDPWVEVVRGNHRRARETFEAALGDMGKPEPISLAVELAGMLFDDGQGASGYADFRYMVVIQYLIDLEEEMLQGEYAQASGVVDRLARSTEEVREDYRTARAAAMAVPNFAELYRQTREGHNRAARANLDNSNGFLYCFVLPTFYDDGTHEPVGPKDVPWGRPELEEQHA